MKSATTTLEPEGANRPDRVLRTIGRALRVSAKTTPLFSLRYPRAVLRAVRLIGAESYTAAEILRLGLLDPALTAEDLGRFTSRQAMTVLERRLNPVAWRTLADDKGVFYRHCAALGLPTPRLCAIFLRPDAGWTPDLPLPRDREEWTSFLESACPPDLVIKPAFGAYGQDVRVLSRTADGQFMEPSGKTVRAVELVDQLAMGAGTRGWVIQERLWNHPDLVRLSGTPYLQCARLLTLTDRAGEGHLLHAHLKIIVGPNSIDNFHFGATGNVTARADLTRGTLFPAVTPDPNGPGYRHVSTHPDTGAAIAGFQLPCWEEARQLAFAAARAFLPLRFVGWDIALTPAGPILVEANWNADPPNPHGRLHLLRAAIERLA